MNTDLFDASVLCCACGGGSTAAEEYVEDVVSGECVNLDNTALLNSYGQGCSYYEESGYEAECPYMNTDYFDASVLCCACGGGSIPGSNTSDDSTSTDDTSTSDDYDSTSTDGTTIETGHWLWLESTRADGSYELDYSTNTGTLYLSDGSMTA